MCWGVHSWGRTPAMGRFTQSITGLFPSHQKPPSKRVWREVCMEQRFYGFLEAPSSLHWGHNPPLHKWLQKTQVMVKWGSGNWNVRISLSKPDGKRQISGHPLSGVEFSCKTYERANDFQPKVQPHFLALKDRQGLAWGKGISIYSLQMNVGLWEGLGLG